jgi:hypothetical protein
MNAPVGQLQVLDDFGRDGVARRLIHLLAMARPSHQPFDDETDVPVQAVFGLPAVPSSCADLNDQLIKSIVPRQQRTTIDVRSSPWISSSIYGIRRSSFA